MKRLHIRLENIIHKSEIILRKLQKDKLLSESLSSTNVDIPKPYLGGGKIKLIIIGSEPGSQCYKESIIKTVMNLDRKDSIHYDYISRILKGLHLKFDNLYATNFYKCFFSKGDFRLKRSSQYKYWIDLLKEEINYFHGAAIISTCETLFSTFLTKGNVQTIYYWDYSGGNDSRLNFKFIESKNNIFNRNIFPFPNYKLYKASIFYVNYLNNYLEWMRNMLKTHKRDNS